MHDGSAGGAVTFLQALPASISCKHFLQAPRLAHLCVQCEVQVVGKEQIAACASWVQRISEVRKQPAGKACGACHSMGHAACAARRGDMCPVVYLTMPLLCK
jgi:hypothetical protein